MAINPQEDAIIITNMFAVDDGNDPSVKLRSSELVRTLVAA